LGTRKIRHVARCLTRNSDLLSSRGGREFGFGLAFKIPCGHEHNLVAEGIPKYVVHIGRAIDFKETWAAGVCSVQPSVEQNTQFGELLCLVRAQIFNHSR
jgi:hypothetical protein